jgi:hypothetical protein
MKLRKVGLINYSSGGVLMSDGRSRRPSLLAWIVFFVIFIAFQFWQIVSTMH